MIHDTERLVAIANAIREADKDRHASGDEYWAIRAARTYMERERPYGLKLSEITESQLKETMASPDFNIQVNLVIAMERLTDAITRYGRVS